jgi:hypothetical protein
VVRFPLLPLPEVAVVVMTKMGPTAVLVVAAVERQPPRVVPQQQDKEMMAVTAEEITLAALVVVVLGWQAQTQLAVMALTAVMALRHPLPARR